MPSPLLLRASFFALLAPLGAVAADAPATVYRIHNRWYPNEWLGEEGGAPVCKEGDGDAWRWSLTPAAGGQVALVNKATGHALLANAGGGAITAGDRAAPAASWTLETVDGGWKALHARDGGYLNIEHRLGAPSSDMQAKPGPQDRWSGQWELVYAEGPRPPRTPQPGIITVMSPEDCGDSTDEQKISLAAPGLDLVEAFVWHGDKREKIASVKPGADGLASFMLHLASAPRGPVALRLEASGPDGAHDLHVLQLFHATGKQGGGAGKAPPAAAGMKPLFVDDFDKPLSISASGKDAVYSSHKPGGGDFSGIPFGDFEKKDSNPFSVRDGFLRIRADELKNTAGLLSSLRGDGTGVVAKAPCYFECRFIGPDAIGSWPAFWIMSQDTWKGGQTPVDEFDVIEAYGGEGPGNPNYPGYEVTSHYWNQGPEGEKQPGLHKSVALTAAPFHGSSWYEDFHTYGIRVGVDETVYYCDDIEIGRHPTSRLSKEQPLFFFINLAIGGISGWKKDLSRSGGVADMYVDFVRVYQGER